MDSERFANCSAIHRNRIDKRKLLYSLDFIYEKLTAKIILKNGLRFECDEFSSNLQKYTQSKCTHSTLHKKMLLLRCSKNSPSTEFEKSSINSRRTYDYGKAAETVYTNDYVGLSSPLFGEWSQSASFDSC